MKAVIAFTRAIDEISRWFGIIAIYFVLFCSLLSAFAATLRYSTDRMKELAVYTGSDAVALVYQAFFSLYSATANTLSDAQWYMFAGMVMLGAAWTLKVNEHVRVDLVYGWVSERTRTWIDLLGGIFFLLPMCALMLYFTWPWFWQAWVTGEGSNQAGGLIRWPVKLMVPLGFSLVGLQGVAEIIKCILALTTDYVREFAYEKPVQ